MYTILMRNDKSLISTHKAKIFEKESNVDMIQFLVPRIYEDNDLTTFVALIKYTTPDGQKRCEELCPQDQLYKGHIDYRLNVDTDITMKSGNVEIRLTFLKVDRFENGENKSHILYTNIATIPIYPFEIFDNVDSDNDNINQIISDMSAQIENLSNITYGLKKNKADDIEIIDGEIWLTANGEKIGDPIQNQKYNNQWGEY